MATYLVLSNWTEQGIKDVKESPRRLDAGRELARTFGVDRTAVQGDNPGAAIIYALAPSVSIWRFSCS
jgi:hypothetical protein